MGQFRPEPPLVGLAELPSSQGDWLAGKSTAQKIDIRPGTTGDPPFRERPDVIMAWHLRPMLCENTSAPRVDLDLADDRHSGPLEPEIDSAYPGEQAQDVHFWRYLLSV